MTSKAKHNFNFRIFEQPVANPKTLEEAERNRTPNELTISPSDRVICGWDVDTCRRAAREYAEKVLKRWVRSVSIGPDGIAVVVYAEGSRLPIGEPVSEKALTKGLPR